jgi:SsrA-binding protein
MYKVMKKNKPNQAKVIRNRRVKFDYNIEDSLVVGLVLSGAEVKSLRMGHGDLKGAYVNNRNNELYLINATITGAKGITIEEQDKTRDRKILAKRSQIDKLLEIKKQGRALVPQEIINSGRYIKLRVAIGKGKKKYDKRANLKERDERRQIDRAVSR